MAISSHLVRSFRQISQRNELAAAYELGQHRAKTAPENFKDLLDSFTAGAPKHAHASRRRPKTIAALTAIPPLPKLTLGSELLWSVQWILPAIKLINSHCEWREKLSRTLEAGDADEFSSSLYKYEKLHSKSYWLLELDFFTEHTKNGQEAIKARAKEIQRTSRNSLSALISLILIDRLDNSHPYDAFISRCRSAFPNFSKPLDAYLKFKINHEGRTADEFASVLSVDLTTSTIDYYESLVEILDRIREFDEVVEYKPIAKEVSQKLLANGIADYRLKKILASLDQNFSAQITLHKSCSESDAWLPKAILLGEMSTITKENSQLHQVLNNLEKCNRLGVYAQTEIISTIKFGLNIKGLPLGQALALKAIHSSSTAIDKQRYVPAGADLFWRENLIEEHLWRPQPFSPSFINSHASFFEEYICYINDPDTAPKPATPNGPLGLWMAEQLADKSYWEAADQTLRSLSALGPLWHRHASKLRVIIFLKKGDQEAAIDLALEWIEKNIHYSYELPLSSIFKAKTWNDFKSLDPIIVGLLSHHAYTTEKDIRIRYICRMACRQFYKTDRNSISDFFESINDERKHKRFIAFIRDTWNEDNLALVEKFSSTQEMRRERITILQYLFSWDEVNSASYAAEIKSLTLDETLWLGLTQINQTRIFVNEAAITRWAERELLHDFDRWKQLKGTEPELGIPSDIFRNYIINPDIDKALSSLPSSEATTINGLLWQLVDRLLKRFMTDPTDGLDCYLSVRVRHGSLRGTLLGPLEKESMLINGPVAKDAFRLRWRNLIEVDEEAESELLNELTKLATSLQEIIGHVLNELVQVRSQSKPSGIFSASVDPKVAVILDKILTQETSFNYFLGTCYSAFWTIITTHRKILANQLKGDIKAIIQNEFNKTEALIRERFTGIQPLITALRTISTTTQSECDAVADWFDSAGDVERETYQLDAAVEIAKRATKNVYRAFPADIHKSILGAEKVLLSTHGLAILTDCLFIIFENAWKRSGLGASLGQLNLEVSYHPSSIALEIYLENDLSPERIKNLKNGQLENLRETYSDEIPVHMVAKEGGSGLAKLARMCIMIDRSKISEPFNFGLTQENRWYVRAFIPLYEREGAFDAYE